MKNSTKNNAKNTTKHSTKNSTTLNIAILCGGNGTRLFPISRELMPKQFVPFFNGKSLFGHTILRNMALSNDFFVITNEAQYFLAKDNIEQLSKENTKIPRVNYILESISKNTASALLFIALSLPKDSIILALPSDHIIKDLQNYQKAIKNAQNLAQKDKIVVFGIKPTNPNTGYGYISEIGGKVEFFEKPNLKNAIKYLKSGQYFWNSGMFCFKASVLIDEFRAYKPQLLKEANIALQNAFKSGDFTKLKLEHCKDLEDISIDYAIMEKSKKLELLRVDFAWNDVGSFDALRDEFSKDSNNNASNREILTLDSKNNFVLSNKLTTIVGASDLIVVDTADCLMISKSGESQKIKDIVKMLKDKNSEIVKIHNIAYRPWGSYQVLLEGEFYKIKQIIVAPKKRLSLQKHFHRNEHWVVVRGSAVVNVDGKEFILRTNESTYIPMGSVHRLSNEGKIELVIIEVQVGEYLGEDDIVRLDDDFHRK